MKRLIVSTIVVAAFVFYAVASRGEVPAPASTGADVVAAASSTETTVTQTTLAQTTLTPIEDLEDDAVSSPQQTTTSQRPTTTTTAASGLYRDGTYTGSKAALMYGTVQVRVTVGRGQIADIEFLTLPSGRRESDRINSYAAPILKQETIQAQSAQVQVVSGATLTSRAFRESLQAALDQA